MKANPIEGIPAAALQDALQEPGLGAILAPTRTGWVFGGMIRVTIQQQATDQDLGIRVSCLDLGRDKFEHFGVVAAAIKWVLPVTPAAERAVGGH